MVDVTDASFEDEVLSADGPVVVDFWAPWCGPCEAVEPILEDLQRAHARLRFARVDVDENLATPHRYGVLSIPTVILFEGGEERGRVVGARPRAHYEREFGDWLSLPEP